MLRCVDVCVCVGHMPQQAGIDRSKDAEQPMQSVGSGIPF